MIRPIDPGISRIIATLPEALRAISEHAFIVDGYYELVWRVFARTLIHEWVYRCRPDIVEWSRSEPYPIFSIGGDLHFAPHSEYWNDGFPLPEATRLRIDTDTECVRIFMDDLFLCPSCAAYHKSDYAFPNAAWIIRRKHRIDERLLWSDVASRLSCKEFSIKSCANRAECAADRRRRRREKIDAFYRRHRQRRAQKEAEELAKARIELETRRNRRQEVYAIRAGNFVKIGIAADVLRRLAMLQISSPRKLELIRRWSCENARQLEDLLHRRFATYRRSGEWFELPEKEVSALLSTTDCDLKRDAGL